MIQHTNKVSLKYHICNVAVKMMINNKLFFISSFYYKKYC